MSTTIPTEPLTRRKRVQRLYNKRTLQPTHKNSSDSRPVRSARLLSAPPSSKEFIRASGWSMVRRILALCSCNSAFVAYTALKSWQLVSNLAFSSGDLFASEQLSTKYFQVNCPSSASHPEAPIKDLLEPSLIRRNSILLHKNNALLDRIVQKVALTLDFIIFVSFIVPQT